MNLVPNDDFHFLKDAISMDDVTNFIHNGLGVDGVKRALAR